MDIYSRKSIVNTFKTELTSQFNRYHQIKLGAEYRGTSITLNNLTILQSFTLIIIQLFEKPEDNEIHDSFQSMINPFNGDSLNGRHPVEFSAYIQDKIEKDDLVVNLGIRYDYFDSQFWVLNDYRDPNYLSPVIPINRWHDTNGDGQISESEMNNDNLKTIDERLETNAEGDPWYDKANT